jgi:hypothetical protein
MRVTFNNVRVNELFSCNGNLYYKKSTRTAVLMSANRTFYMSQKDICLI